MKERGKTGKEYLGESGIKKEGKRNPERTGGNKSEREIK